MENNEAIVNETLLESKRYIQVLIHHLNLYLQYSNEGKSNEANELLIKLAEGLDWQFRALELLSDKLKSAINKEETQEILTQINSAILNRDNVLLKDLFEYELIPILERDLKIVEKEIKDRKLK